ncbi:hypothetical protein [Niallia sp. Krafla_26]|uniref:hypothetical protein n=1 Tax=Niallia sp. Krafla_26 TaxID=3064703 RepID=UPI003D17B8B8
MQQNRKQIIIHEILYWKENQLLPTKYCDFLLALYTEGSGLPEKPLERKSRRHYLFYLLFIPIGLFLLYFTELSLTLQIVSGIIFVMLGIYLTMISAKKKMFFHIPLILTAIIVLFISVELTLSHTSNQIGLYIVIGCNCVVWLLTGLKFKQLYFSISGIAGTILLIFFMFFPF